MRYFIFFILLLSYPQMSLDDFCISSLGTCGYFAPKGFENILHSDPFTWSYLIFLPDRTWSFYLIVPDSLFQKGTVHTNLDIYVLFIYSETVTYINI